MTEEAHEAKNNETYENSRLHLLEIQNSRLTEELRRIENEKRYLESEVVRLQRELRRLKVEIDRLRFPPLIIGQIRDVLADGRVVVKSSTGPDFVVNVSETIPPPELKAGARVALNKQTLAVMNVLLPSLDPIVMGAEIIEKPQESYADIGGLDEQIREVREAIEFPLLKPELYRKVGIQPPKGVLLVGPPGTGKTLIAKAVAKQTSATFIRLVGSELVQKYIGEGARLVRELFEMSKLKAPSIVFIDELDAIGAKRLDVSTSGDREVQRTLMQLLAEMDGFNPLSNVKILAATNRPDILDDALLRPGRFDRIITIPMPNLEARISIFKIHIKPLNVVGEISIEGLSRKTENCTGADIKAICTEAGMFAIRDERDYVVPEDFEKAIIKVLGRSKKQTKAPSGMFV